ncbi:MAG: T9SS type A sorting domain-containing protein, partial [Rhodothermales bacterium]
DLERAIPRDARILNVTLTFHTSEAPVGGSGTEIFVLRVTRDWGESASNAGDRAIEGARAQQGDATWTHAIFDVATWQNAGGDFAAAPSASVSVGRPLTKYVVKSTEALENDVQLWLDAPEANHGWILIGDEVRESTTRRLNSRFHRDEPSRPRMTVIFSVPTSSESPARTSAFEVEGIAPNPVGASGTIRYVLDRPQTVRFIIYDVTGRPIYTATQHGRAGENGMRVDTGILPSGLYIYCLTPETGSRTCRTMTRVR